MSLFETDIFDQLKEEHKEVKELLERATKCAKSQRTSFLKRIEKNLVPHARGEEKTLYSVLLKRAVDLRENDAINLANEAYEEHRVVDKLIADLKKTDPASDQWLAKMMIIKENVEHHIEEEERELFSQAKRLLTNEEQTSLVDVYQQAKETYEKSLPTQDQIEERTPSQEAKPYVA